MLPDELEPDPTYREILSWIWSFSTGPSEARLSPENRDLRLERMRALLSHLGDPHLEFPSLLVAGTKGKGSTVAMAASSLHASGHLRVGRYTSPHLVNWRERTWVDGSPISTGAVVSLADELRRAVADVPASLGLLTTFEVGTALTFLHFARESIDVAVVEVGVGGTHDATNVLEPLASAITPISLDHVGTLGGSIEAIAAAKSGVLRPGRTAVIGPQPHAARTVVESHAATLGTTLEWVGEDWRWSDDGDGTTRIGGPGRAVMVRLPLLGKHQRDNAATAVGLVDLAGRTSPSLRLTDRAIEVGLSTVDWPGRLQVLASEPLVVADGAHNEASARALRQAVAELFLDRPIHLVVGLTEGKDHQGFLDALLPVAASARFTRARNERAAEPEHLAGLARSILAPTRIRIAVDFKSAIAEAADDAAREGGLVLVTGSLFLVGEAMTLLAPA